MISKIEIKIPGKKPFNFENITINENIYGIDNFAITCRYDAFEKNDGFMVENSRTYLGLPITIQTTAKIGSQEKPGHVFKGFITEIQGSRSDIAENDRITISGGSMEIQMSGKPRCRAFNDKTLEEIVKEVLSSYSFSNKVQTRDKFRYPYIVQYQESDMEFLKRLSIRYGEWFFYNGTDMIFGELPKKDLDMTIGFDLNDFQYQLRINPVKFSMVSIDPLNSNIPKYVAGSGKADSNLNIHGKHALKESKKLFAEEGLEYFEHLNVEETAYQKAIEKEGERDEVSDAVNLSDMSGNSTNPFIAPGMYARVSCLYEKGKTKIPYLSYLITSVQHSFDNLLTYNNSFSAVSAETTIPEYTDPYFIKTTQNQIGTVKDNVDPDKLGRVKIAFPWMDGNSTPWVRCITPYVEANSGVAFVPAIGTRVLVGFEGGNIEKPYCLGNLFDKDYPPDSAWAGAKIHAIRTASGQTIEFNDDSGSEKIRIYDTNNKNEITLDAANGEIKIKATEKLTIEAKEIEIKAQMGMKIEAGQTLEQKGMDIKTEAQTSLEAKAASVEINANASLKASGSASAEVSSSGVMTVKGSMVMIN